MTYDEAMAFATIFLKKHPLPIEPADLVNEAYIKGQLTKKAILNEYYSEKFYAIGTNQEFNDKQRHVSQTYKYCPQCKEHKPFSCFRTMYDRRRTPTYSFANFICLTCEPEYKRKRYAQWKKTRGESYIKQLAAKQAIRNKRYYAKNKKTTAFKTAKRRVEKKKSRKDAMVLSERYLRGVIKNGYRRRSIPIILKSEDITPEMITQARQRILLLRQKRQERI
jgi:hypothetical protein